MTDFLTTSSTYRHPRGLRWQCNGCAKCCSSGLAIGPVEPEIVNGLRDGGIEETWPPARSGWLEEREAADGSQHFFFQLRQGRCVFLRDDNLCAIHALMGAKAKPGFCREVPYHFVEDMKGVTAVVRPACGSFFEGFQRDDEVGPELEDVHRLPRVTPHRRWSPSQVVVLPGKAIDAASWLRVEEALLERLHAREEQPDASVAYIRETLCSILDASPPKAQSAQYQAALDALIGVLARVLHDQGGTVQHVADDHRQRFLEQSLERLHRAHTTDAGPWESEERAYANLLLGLSSVEELRQLEVPEGLGVFCSASSSAPRQPTRGSHSASISPSGFAARQPDDTRAAPARCSCDARPLLAVAAHDTSAPQSILPHAVVPRRVVRPSPPS